MVVDDDRIFRMLVTRVAAQLGVTERLLLCADLASASRECARADFWVVDVNLPDGLGPTWVEHQRSEGFLQSVLLLSHSEWREDLAGLQPCEFARKPSALESLREMMQGWWTA